MKKLFAYIRLMRPLNLFQGGIAVLVTGTLMKDFPEWQLVLFALGIVWALTGAGNALNDYCDAEIDRVNRPGRPIPRGLITPKAALVFSVALFLTGIILVIPIISAELLVIVGLAIILMIIYSLYLKVRPFWGNLTVALILGMAFLFAGAVFGDIGRGIPPFFLAFGFTLIREIIKDIQDVKGDRKVAARTVPLQYGIPLARRLVFLLTILLMIGALIPYYLHIYGVFYLLVLIFAVEIPLIYFLYSLGRDSSPDNCGRLSSLLKADIFFGLLAIFVGKY